MGANESFVLNIKALFDASDIRAKVGQIQQSFSKLKLPDGLRTGLETAFKNVEKSLSNFESRVEKGVSTKADAKGIGSAMDAVVRSFERLQVLTDKIKSELGSGADLTKIIQLDDATLEKIKTLRTEIEGIKKQIAEVNSGKLENLKKILGEIKTAGAAKQGQAAFELFSKGESQAALDVLDKIIAKLNSMKQTAGTINSATQLDLMRTEIQNAFDETSRLYDQITAKTQEIGAVSQTAMQQIANGAIEGANSLNNLNDQIYNASGGVKDFTNNTAHLNTELDSIKSRIQYFFGLSNAINIFKRAVTSAFNTVKELDAAMTETAVVTDKTVSDMWSQLPEYTARANKLGVTTLEAYKAATLYYQQGLNDQQAAELSEETLRMARIAGLDAAEATDRMTNALRGFNMELNSVNAQRVDDVYSKLAAMSASNVDEISTAMTKVASLASNANMDFETTSAFLAQIIETTRESAETAGTALKTVIARFSEVKKLYSEDQLKGTTEEGEVIDVNKIATALRTAGIDLNKYFLGEVGLDDIFMELASKWDSLTSVQQRYIATQAAGSRQQSRFIALMQDYARTQELVSAAYDANGASAEQFEKTQDSLQSKLARLKNAWDEFTMGLANSAVIKVAVDALRLLLQAVNGITGAFGPAIGGTLKLVTALTALVGLRKAFSSGGIADKLLGKFGESNLGKLVFGRGGGNEVATNSLDKAVARAGELTKNFATESGEIIKDAATEAADETVKAGTEAAEAMKEGVTGTAEITEKAAAEEVAIKKTGATDEVAIRQQGAAEEVATKQAGTVEEVAIGQEGAAEETALRLEGAANENAISQVSASEEATVEINGAIQEEAIEAKGNGNFEMPKNLSKKGGNFTNKIPKFAKKYDIADDVVDSFSEITSDASKQIFQSLDDVSDIAKDLTSSTGTLGEGAEILKVALGPDEVLTSVGKKTISPSASDQWLASIFDDGAKAAAKASEKAAKSANGTPFLQYLFGGGAKGSFGEAGADVKRLFGSLKGPAIAAGQTSAMTTAEIFADFTALSGASAALAAGLGVLLIAVEAGGTWLQDYIASGKRDVKRAEKNRDEEQKKLEEVQDKRIKQEEAYNQYLQAQKNARQAATEEEKVEANAQLADAIKALADVDSKNVSIDENTKELKVNDDYAKQQIEELKQQETNQKLTVGLADALVGLAEIGKLEKSKLKYISPEKQVDEVTGMVTTVQTKGGSWYANSQYVGQEISEEQVIAHNAQIDAQKQVKQIQVAKQVGSTVSTYMQDSGYDEQISQIVSAAYGGIVSILDEDNLKKEFQDSSRVVENLQKIGEVAKDENGAKLLEIIGGTYEGAISNEDLYKLFDSIGEGNKNTLYNLLNTDATGINEILADYNTKLQAIQRPLRNKAIVALENSGIFDTGILEKVATDLTTSQINELLGYTDQWSDFGDEFNNKILTNIVDAMAAGEWDNSELKDFAMNISDNPVMALRAIKDAAENATGDVQELATKLLDITNSGEGVFSTEGQLQWFLTSQEFENIEEELQSIVETNGQLTSHNIEELAKSSKTLAAMLEDGTMSANGLAFALTALEKGNITLLDLNSNVLQLFNSFDMVGNAIERAGQFIKNFNPGEDYGDALDFINGAIEKIEEFVGNKEFGNPQYQNYWKAIFGTEAPTNAADAQAGIDLAKRMTENNGQGFWTEAVGFQIENGRMDRQLYGEENSYEAWTGEGSYQDYIKSLVKENSGYEFSDDFYDLMFRNLANRQPEFVKKVAAAELDKAMAQYADAAGDAKPSKQDIQAIADAWGLDPQEVLDAYNEQKGTDYQFDALEDQIRRTTTKAENLWMENSLELADTAAKKGFDSQYIGRHQNDSSFILSMLGTDENGVFSMDQLKVRISEVVPEVKDGSMTVEEWFNEQAKEAADKGEPLKLPVEYDVATKNEETGEWSVEHKTVEIEVKNLEEYQQISQQIIEQSRQQALFENSEAWAANLLQTLQDINKIPGVTNLTSSLETAQSEADDLIKSLSDIEAHVKVVSDTTSFTVTGAGGTMTFTLGTAAKGGIVSAANGTISAGLALTGEEGSEIVWNKEKGYAYLAGANGPEVNNLKPGDQVFNAQDTKAILRRSGIKSFAKGSKIPSYAYTKTTLEEYMEMMQDEFTTQSSKELQAHWRRRLKQAGWYDQFKDDATDEDDNNNSSGGNGEGGSGGTPQKKKPDWENTLDWLYNLMEDVAELERIQTRLSETHDRYLEDISKTGRDLYNVTKDQLKNLYTQRDNQQEVLNRRLQEMREQITEADEELTKYVWWNAEDKTIEIDWDAINEIDNEDTFKEVTDLVSKAEKIQDQIDEADDALWEIEDSIKELENRYLEEFVDLQKRVYEAVVDSYQKQIDALTSINETINDSNEQILNSIQKEIELQRQIRDNTDTETDLREKEARLAYLRRDTTGANTKEIRDLEKEIEEARRKYADTLIDQSIDRLSQQNDDASEERQKQIDLLTQQLDYWKEIGALWPEVARLLDEGINGEGSLIRGSTLEQILQSADGWQAMSEQEREVWANELILSVNQAGAYLIKISEGLDTLSEGIWALIPESSIPAWDREPYASGGLATKTGLAWLDGTVNEPEYVLNARQTEAFLKLAEVLPDIFNGDLSGATNNYGNNIYVELNMNVGEISDDYDVDRIVERVKEDIYNVSSYRNVNSVSFTR